MRFAHIADCHLGFGNNEALKEITIHNFCKAVNECLKRDVDFVIIAGDLFDNPLPNIDVLKIVAKQLRMLKDRNIDVFAIPGSHDYSPTSKTMISVLEAAGLLFNVAKVEYETLKNNQIVLKPFVTEKLCITGVPGRFSGLERDYFKNLVVDCNCKSNKHSNKQDDNSINTNNTNNNNSNGCVKIFLFHTAITEFLRKNMLFESIPAELLPQGFDYYAGGHLHIRAIKKIDDKWVVYPGPLACTSFDEFLSIKNNSFFIVSLDNKNEPRFEEVVVSEHNTVFLEVNCDNKTPSQVNEEILNNIPNLELNNSVLLLMLKGVLAVGRPSDIDFASINSKAISHGCKALIRNTSKLTTKDFEESNLDTSITDVESLEKEIIQQHIGQSKTWFNNKEETLITALTRVLNLERSDEESKSGYQDRVISEAGDAIKKILDMH